MIGVIDYGAANITSVIGALQRLGGETRIVGAPGDLAGCEKIILPGVGAFGDGIEKLCQRALVEPLTRRVMEDRVPFLGICLGAQLIARSSDEGGQHRGLAWIDAEVVRLTPDDPTLRLPHVGWNDFEPTRAAPLFDGLGDKPLFYYVHSHHIVPDDPTMSTGECNYGERFVAAIQHDNIHAVQFHPEKSQRDGLTVLSNFLKL